MLRQKGCFKGIDVKATKDDKGNFVIKMSTAEWKIFRSNQSGGIKTKKSAGGAKSSVKAGGTSVDVSMNTSASNLLVLFSDHSFLLFVNCYSIFCVLYLKTSSRW